MTRENCKALLASGVLQAWANGEAVEMHGGDFDWYPVEGDPQFNMPPGRFYRIAPKRVTISWDDLAQAYNVAMAKGGSVFPTIAKELGL